MNSKCKKVMIIGAGPLQNPMILKAKELGNIVIAVDRDKEALGSKEAHEFKNIDIIDKEKCLKYAREKQIDGVLTVATDYGVLTTSYIAKELNLKALEYSRCEIVKNKYKIRECLKENFLEDIGEVIEVETIYDIEKVKSKMELPVIVKPIDGSGSKGVSIIRSICEFEEKAINAIEASISHKAIIEKFIKGTEYGVEIFVENDNIHILAILEKTMTKPPVFAELGHAVVIEEKKIKDKISSSVIKAIRALGINFGSVNMDVLVNDKEVNIIDIGARAGGNLISSHIVPLSTGIDLYANSIRAALGEKTNFKFKERITPIATRILNFKAGVVDYIDYNEINKLMKLNYVKDIIINVKKGSIVREYKNNLDSCGYVVVEGINKDDAKRKALFVRNQLEMLIDIK
ncbi:TPA: ATP-grasp domain-containing protein [Clostridium perfringens]|nr:ATP-grasp domain-containing protein [Clostridium perfringens]HAT4284980.1 ATP-grasp domain-containing protein [Clostridium perfringens]